MTQARLDIPLICPECAFVLCEEAYATPMSPCPKCGSVGSRSEAPGMSFVSNSWIKTHAEALRSLLPDTWTHVTNLKPLFLLFHFKLLGLRVTSTADLADCLARLEREKLLVRDGVLIRKNLQRIDHA